MRSEKVNVEAKQAKLVVHGDADAEEEDGHLSGSEARYDEGGLPVDHGGAGDEVVLWE